MGSGALDLPAIARFLREQGVPVDGDVRAELIAGGKSNLTFDLRTDTEHWVLRRPPVSGLTPSAHDMAREYTVVEGLARTGVPVAQPVALCRDESVTGAPFAITEFVPGRVIRSQDELDAVGDGEVARCADALVRVLADLHAVDPGAVGLGDFGKPDGYLQRQVSLWAKQWARVRRDDVPAVQLADAERLHARLAEACPAGSAVSVVHGDYRIDNTIVAGDDAADVRAVVDWELSTLGDPLADVALMCVYRDPLLELVLGWPAAWTSERLPSADALAGRYADVSGRDLRDWGFYLGLANFKLGAIAAGIDHRHRQGATVGEGFERVADSVPRFFAAGLAAVAES